MKKILFSPACFMLVLASILSSCSKEELIDKDLVKESTTSVKDVRLLAAGMGPYDVLGHGYNVTGEYGSATAAGAEVIDINKFKQAQANRLIEENPRTQEYLEEYGENALQYSKTISNKVDVTTGFAFFKSTISYNFSSSDVFDSKYIYGSYNLTIKQKRYRLNASVDLLKNYLTAEFIADLKSRTPQELVNDYGTHVLIDVYTGGKLDVMFQAQTTNQDRQTAARAGIKVSVLSVFGTEINNNIDTKNASQNFSKTLSYRTRGGDPTKQLNGEINLDLSTPKISTTAWQNSATADNAVFVDIGQHGLIPLYELISDASKKASIKGYIEQYLKDNQVVLISTSIPIYAYFSQKGNDHYIATDPNIANRDPYWANEGITFRAFSYQAPGTVPVYSYNNESSKDHYSSTATLAELNAAAPVWELLGVNFYAYSSPGADRIPVYNYINKNKNDNYLSTDPNIATRDSYWTKLGIAFYVPAK